MKTSRIVQLVILLIVFVVGVLIFNSSGSSNDASGNTTGDGYIPPQP